MPENKIYITATRRGGIFDSVNKSVLKSLVWDRIGDGVRVKQVVAALYGTFT